MNHNTASKHIEIDQLSTDVHYPQMASLILGRGGRWAVVALCALSALAPSTQIDGNSMLAEAIPAAHVQPRDGTDGTGAWDLSPQLPPVPLVKQGGVDSVSATATSEPTKTGRKTVTVTVTDTSAAPTTGITEAALSPAPSSEDVVPITTATTTDLFPTESTTTGMSRSLSIVRTFY